MILHCLFICRKGQESNPELLLAWDEYSVDENVEGFEQARTEALKSCQSEIAVTSMVYVEVPDQELLDAIHPATLKGKVSSEGS